MVDLRGDETSSDASRRTFELIASHLSYLV